MPDMHDQRPISSGSAGCLQRMVRRLVARLRLNEKIVCEESAGLGMADYHDYPDSTDGLPWHMIPMTCKRCGKKFMI